MLDGLFASLPCGRYYGDLLSPPVAASDVEEAIVAKLMRSAFGESEAEQGAEKRRLSGE